MNGHLIFAIFCSLGGIGILILSRGGAESLAKSQAEHPPVLYRSWWSPKVTERQWLIMFRAFAAIVLLIGFYNFILFVVS